MGMLYLQVGLSPDEFRAKCALRRRGLVGEGGAWWEKVGPGGSRRGLGKRRGTGKGRRPSPCILCSSPKGTFPGEELFLSPAKACTAAQGPGSAVCPMLGASPGVAWVVQRASTPATSHAEDDHQPMVGVQGPDRKRKGCILPG